MFTALFDKANHVLNRLNARYRLFRERKGVGHSAHQFVVYINRAAAHARKNAGFIHLPAAQFGDDDVLFGIG